MPSRLDRHLGEARQAVLTALEESAESGSVDFETLRRRARSALGRFVIAQELVRVAHEEGCPSVAHSAASKGNDQVRMETAIAAEDPLSRV